MSEEDQIHCPGPPSDLEPTQFCVGALLMPLGQRRSQTPETSQVSRLSPHLPSERLFLHARYAQWLPRSIDGSCTERSVAQYIGVTDKMLEVGRMCMKIVSMRCVCVLMCVQG